MFQEIALAKPSIIFSPSSYRQAKTWQRANRHPHWLLDTLVFAAFVSCSASQPPTINPSIPTKQKINYVSLIRSPDTSNHLQIPINFVLHISASISMFFHHRYATSPPPSVQPFSRCRGKWTHAQLQFEWWKLLLKILKLLIIFPCSVSLILFFLMVRKSFSACDVLSPPQHHPAEKMTLHIATRWQKILLIGSSDWCDPLMKNLSFAHGLNALNTLT